MTQSEIHKEIIRLQSENRVLKQLIKETQKALSNIDNFADLTILDTVESPFNTIPEHNSSGEF